MRISDWSSDVCSSDLGETEDPELLLLALTQRASDFAPIAVMDAPTELVAQFLPVELKQDPSAERPVVDVSQDVQRIDDAPQFRQGLGKGRWAVFRSADGRVGKEGVRTFRSGGST